MGTIGGKIGYVAGIAAACVALTPLMQLTVGSCFDAGCGRYEGLLLAASLLSAIAAGVVAGLLTRFTINRTLIKR